MKKVSEQIKLVDMKTRLWLGHTPQSSAAKPDYWFCKPTKEEAALFPGLTEAKLIKDLVARAMSAGIELQVEVHSADAERALELTHARKLDKLADEVIKSLAAAGEKYLALCSYIRENDVAPSVVSAQLREKGFSKVTISKINRVAHAQLGR